LWGADGGKISKFFPHFKKGWKKARGTDAVSRPRISSLICKPGAIMLTVALPDSPASSPLSNI
jgi:hypothetical protein